MTLGNAFDTVFHAEIARITSSEVNSYYHQETESLIATNEHKQTSMSEDMFDDQDEDEC